MYRNGQTGIKSFTYVCVCVCVCVYKIHSFFFFFFLAALGLRCSKWAFSSCYMMASLVAELGFPGGSDSKESSCNAGDLGSIPGSRRSPGEGNGNPLQYSCLEHSTNKGVLLGVTKNRT